MVDISSFFIYFFFIIYYRAYIEFERPQHMEQVLQTNTILPAVYLAIKMR